VPHQIKATMVTLVAKHHNGKGLNSVEWEAHRAAICASVRLKHHIVEHCQLSARVHVNLRAEVSESKMCDPRDWSSMINPSKREWGPISQIKPALAKPVAKHHIRKECNSDEWEAHRAAIVCGSVCLEHHIVVHLQLSARGHVNLRAEVSELEMCDPRDWSSTANSSEREWVPTSQIKPALAKPVAKHHTGKSATVTNGRLTAPPLSAAVFASNTTVACTSSTPSEYM